MRYLKLLILLLLAGCASTGKLVNPHHQLMVKPTIFVNQYEVTNYEYLQFLSELKAANETEKLKIAQIDSLKWKSAFVNCDSLVTAYTTAQYYEYPVVNISYEGAQLYCKWLSNKYNSNPKRAYKKLLFRLPTEEEWEQFAKGGHDDYVFPFGYTLKDKTGKYLCNFANVAQESIKLDEKQQYMILDYDADQTVLLENVVSIKPVGSFLPNDYGLMDCAGNVSEMLLERGITKGGSWASPGYYMKVSSRELYSEPDCTIGFRVISEILEK